MSNNTHNSTHDALEYFLLAKIGEVLPATVTWYRSLLTPMAEYLDQRVDSAADVTIHDLRQWRAQMMGRTTRYADHPYRDEMNTRGYSKNTIHDKVNACRIFFKWAAEERVIPSNPSQRLKPTKLPRYKEPKAISERGIRTLIREAYRRENLRDVAIISVLAETGARVAGVAGLRIQDLDLVAGELIVTEKGDKSRPVYVTSDGIKVLRDYLRVRPDADHDYLFVSARGGPLTESGISKMLSRLGDATGVEPCNPHAFRHAFARENLRNGVSLERVSKLMGHEDVQTTANCYAIWTETELHDTHRQAARRRNLWRGVGN